MNHGRALWSGVLVGLLVTRIALPAQAQDEKGGGPPTRAEFTKLQNDVKEQRDLIIQMLQTEQQRYDMLLRLMAGQNAGAAAAIAGMPSAAPAVEAAPAETSAAPRRARVEVERRNGSIDGKVSFPGGDMDDVYVYVENVKGAPIHNKVIEIRQEGKQFMPRSAVVQAGTTVAFPNNDSIYHNVFSLSGRNSFDLGSYRGGDKARTVTLTSPGVVDIFCNMHQKMSASVLVVPNALYTKVKSDGSFHIDNVPVGSRKVVAWSPRSKPMPQRVEVTGNNSEVSFSLTRQDSAAHSNKLGQAYGSYKD